MKVKIYGAGSIGNHYAYACRKKNWDVTIFDKDVKALERTKKKIYVSRYGRWDSKIKLLDKDNNNYYDIIIIGTPPDSHLSIALNAIKFKPKVIHIEKPFCTPDLKGLKQLINKSRQSKTKIVVGYNHLHTKCVDYVRSFLKNKEKLGKIKSLYAYNKESWSGIFAAHPWLKGPQDSYLGNYKSGGGATNEHSHALNLLLYFIDFLNLGKIKKIQCYMNFIKNSSVNYDSYCNINFKTSKNCLANIIQDVTSESYEKLLIIQGTKGYVKIISNYNKSNDAVEIFQKNKKIILFKKKRPDDFKGHASHLEQIAMGKIKKSPVSFQSAIKNSIILSACYKSAIKNKEIDIDYGI
jgi:predicted dehydrogenase